MKESDIKILYSLGFVDVKNTTRKSLTNIDSEYMTQVWIFLSEYIPSNIRSLEYDASKSFDLESFFKFWEKASLSERNKEEAFREYHNSQSEWADI